MFKLCITGDLGFEFWQDIPGYEGLYQASTYGRIKRLDTYISFNGTISLRKGRILKPGKDKNGYFRVELCKCGVVKQYLVHQIVCNTFIPNYFNYMMINHRDEKPYNNRVENLEWCDCVYNNNYGTRNKRIAEKNGKKVLQFDLEGNLIDEYNSTNEIEKILNYNHTLIGRVCLDRYKNKSAYGFIWKYK